MRTLLNTLITICLLLPLSMFAQEPAFFGQQNLSLNQDENHRCSTMPYLSHQVQQDPSIVERLKAQEEYTARFVANYGQQSSRAVYTIPVVFHVVYNTSAENISDAQLLSQLQVLNEDFRRTNSDADNTWSQAADTEIEFCLATVDPNGNPTTGITRTSTRKKSFSYSNDGVKFSGRTGGVDAWPRDDYLNIWVCDLGNSLLGYAQFPNSGSAATDGVVIDYAYTGTNSTYPYDGGRTATHEVGHWLNLRHIWGDGGCGVDDFVSDTPESDASNGGCPTGHVSCGSVDMIQNYMDYTYDACMNLYTQGQKARMQAVLASGGARASLANSPACGGGGGGPTCAVPSGQSTNASTSSATLSWNSVSNANGYNVRHRPSGGSWTTVSVSGTSYTLNGLGACSSHEWGVEADCGAADGTSGYSSTSSFTTGGCSCGIPGNVSATKRGKNKLRVTWNSVSGATSYEAQARPQGGTWATATTTGTAVNFTGASSGTTYEYQVRANCNGTWGSYSAIGSYNFRAAARTAEMPGVTIYPNPVSDMLTIEFSEIEATTVQIQLIDVLGRVVTQINDHNTADFTVEINVNDFKAGVYFVKISDGKEWNEVSRIVVQ